jgi:hypothetical protein
MENRPGSRTRLGQRRCILLSTVVWIAAGLFAVFGGNGASGGSTAFALREVSGLGVGHGGHFPCRSEPDPNTIYPSFSSTKPLYGEVRIDMEFGSGQSGVPYRFAMDESGGTDAGYDRLYLDLDRDGDLAEEKPLEPMKDPPDSWGGTRLERTIGVCPRRLRAIGFSWSRTEGTSER